MNGIKNEPVKQLQHCCYAVHLTAGIAGYANIQTKEWGEKILATPYTLPKRRDVAA